MEDGRRVPRGSPVLSTPRTLSFATEKSLAELQPGFWSGQLWRYIVS